MAETKVSGLDTPIEEHLFKPDGAEKLPTKSYPASSKLGKGEHKENIIEGPCSSEGSHRGYHK